MMRGNRARDLLSYDQGMTTANAQEAARTVVERLRAASYTAYLVGGCVRDLLLDREPKDWDVATSARPAEVMRLFPDSDLVGAHFGVVLVREEGVQLEVATFRSEGPYSDGRRPDSVDFETDPRRDVLRRDFTINAMMMDPVSGEPIDWVGGREDLRRGVVRTVGDPGQRFTEDHLRMLRAVRFAARFRFTIERATLDAIREQAGAIRRVAAERVRDELVRVLTEGGARYGFELLDETGLLSEILPEVAAMKGVAQPPEFHPEGDVWVHTLLMLERLPAGVPPTLALGVLLHDVGKPPTFRVADRIRFDGHVEAGLDIAGRLLRRLRFSSRETDQVLALVKNHMRFMDAPRMKDSTLKRFLQLERFDEHLELHRLDCLSSHANLDTYEYVAGRRAGMKEEEIRPPRLIGGTDLIAAGYEPGPEFRAMLDAVETAQLEGRIATREEALALVRAEFTAAGGDRSGC
jgi:tRNA nucleotidyltransferase/poly(A) polymerase